jgi:hypothetical protein
MCERCDGTMWVCEKHRDRPWGGESSRPDACDCSPGAPCPHCWTDDGWRERMMKMHEEGRVLASEDNLWKQ